jgi:hypothetical protein
MSIAAVRGVMIGCASKICAPVMCMCTVDVSAARNDASCADKRS